MSFAYNPYLISAALIGLVGYGIYRLIMPNPIPGVPYHPESIRPFGDLPAMMKTMKETKEFSRYMVDRVNELQTPILQIFVEPFSKPWVVVADSMAIEDILAHRSNEFEVSKLFVDLFVAVVPNSLVTKKTKDPAWKLHRRLMADTMTNKFLHGVAAGHIQHSGHELIDLWTEKIRLSQGQPFDVGHDISDLLMDGTWAIAFGETCDIARSHKDFLAALDKLSPAPEKNSVARFPKPPQSETIKAIYTLAESSEIATKSPFRSRAHKAAMIYDSTLRKASAYRHRYIGEKLNDAWRRFSTGSSNVKSAADLLVEKEVFLANKEGRPAVYDSVDVRDELYTFLLGAHDTTATTLKWAVKFLTHHQDVQTKLREELKSVFGDDKNPDSQEIINANLPYTDSCVQEVLRKGCTAPILSRETATDVDILGYRIPKGVQIVMPLTGPGYQSSRLNVAADVKDPFTGNWHQKDIHLFKPERWMVEQNGELKFDPRAGPNHQFSTGTRSCFGKRLALLGLRLDFAMLILNFELQPIPSDLVEFSGNDILTYVPQHTYIRPKRL